MRWDRHHHPWLLAVHGRLLEGIILPLRRDVRSSPHAIRTRRTHTIRRTTANSTNPTRPAPRGSIARNCLIRGIRSCVIHHIRMSTQARRSGLERRTSPHLRVDSSYDVQTQSSNIRACIRICTRTCHTSVQMLLLLIRMNSGHSKSMPVPAGTDIHRPSASHRVHCASQTPGASIGTRQRRRR